MGRNVLNAVSLAATLATATPWHAAASKPADFDTQPLWSQVNEDSGVALSSQNFGESSFDVYDNQGADDFVVPEGENWVIRQIEARGTHWGGSGPLDSMNVVFYRGNDDHPNKPGQILGERPQSLAQAIGFSTNYLVSLAKPVKLPPGHYWVSLQGNLFFAQGGQWGWETTRALTGSHAVWQNPADGFQTGCARYRRLLRCFEGFGQGPDFMYVLYGRRTSNP